uniref:EGF-like domain-containing protein n=1 Tax=Globisporangium ultimum (strain ATCC 200006 / CBS 805.95 / DAOM BR144) TaxID=431595 RepID=K3XAT5_GLOUD
MMLAPVRLLLLLGVSYALLLSPKPVAAVGPRCPGSPNQCSLHGSCMLNRLGERVCNCQWGYAGDDCSKKMCPHGVDPESSSTQDKQLNLVIASSNGAAMEGKFVLSFHSHSVEFETPLEDATSEACTRIFRRFQNIADVSCKRVEYVEASKAAFEITLHSFPVYPVMNNLYHHNGNPLATDFWCDASNVKLARPGDITCTFTSKTDRDVKEYVPCSGRGLCNERIGVCTCDNGYYGENCGNNKDEEDILVAPSAGPFFKGNVLRVTAKRAMASEFNLIKADVSGHTVFTVNGEGDTTLHRGSLFVKDGDLVVQNGGQVQIQGGGGLTMDHADLQVKDAQLRMQLAKHSSISKHHDAMLLLEMAVAGDANTPDFMRLMAGNSPVFRVTSASGAVIHQGGLEVLSGGVKVQRGGIHVLSDGIKVTNGALSIKNGALRLQSSSLQVNDGQASFATASTILPALSVLRTTTSGSQRQFGASGVVELRSEGENDVLLLAKGKQDAPVFEVKASGNTIVHAGGLQVSAGGVRIVSGGQTITSGGLHIESGGAFIEGELTTTGGFKIQGGGFTVQNNELNAPSLRVKSTHANFGGALLSFDLSEQLQRVQSGATRTTHPFRLFEAVDAQRDPIISVDSFGNVIAQGDIRTTHGGKVIASGAMIAQAQAVFSHMNLEANAHIAIPSSHSYVKITDDGAVQANQVTLDRAAAFAGQLLVIQNNDEQSLDGDVAVKPGATAMFLFDGSIWRALTAAALDAAVITGVTHFDAANDLNFGDIKLTVKNVQLAGQKPGLIAFYGKGGELMQDSTLGFDAASHTFSTYNLRAEVIQGSIDMSESELRHVEIVGGHISNVNMTSIERMEVDGELFVELDAFFGSGITVDGQVMGSGAYVDASDARFKRDITPITNSSAVLHALQGVEYSYRVDAFPNKNFPKERELGFLAQDVERVLPQVISEDAQGFKYVAYARVVPVIVEAIKEVNKQVRTCEDDMASLRMELHELRQLLFMQQQQIDELLRVQGRSEPFKEEGTQDR